MGWTFGLLCVGIDNFYRIGYQIYCINELDYAIMNKIEYLVFYEQDWIFGLLCKGLDIGSIMNRIGYLVYYEKDWIFGR